MNKPNINSALTKEGEEVSADKLLEELHGIMVKSHIIDDGVLSALDERLLVEINGTAKKYFCDRNLFGR